MGWVVPVGRELGGRSVEDDPAPHEHDPLDEAFDGTELVRDVEDGDPERLVQLAEEGAEGLLCVDVDAGCRLVEDEELRLARERLCDERALLLPARAPLDRRARLVFQAARWCSGRER